MTRRATDSLAGYELLLADVVRVIEDARRAAARSVNAVMTATYWLVGRRIVEQEQHGTPRAGYGEQLLKRLSRDLSKRFGRGFSERNIEQMRAFYLGWPIPQAPSAKSAPSTDLGWEGDISQAAPAKSVADPRDIQPRFPTSSSSSISRTSTPRARSRPRSSRASRRSFSSSATTSPSWDASGASGSTTWYRVDLLFFHRRLRCLVVIDLKIGKFTHADAGQMHLYLNYAREHWMRPGENPPVGLILCAKKGEAVARYALEGLPNKVLAAEYRTTLPDEKTIAAELDRTQRILEERRRLLPGGRMRPARKR